MIMMMINIDVSR